MDDEHQELAPVDTPQPNAIGYLQDANHRGSAIAAHTGRTLAQKHIDQMQAAYTEESNQGITSFILSSTSPEAEAIYEQLGKSAALIQIEARRKLLAQFAGRSFVLVLAVSAVGFLVSLPPVWVLAMACLSFPVSLLTSLNLRNWL